VILKKIFKKCPPLSLVKFFNKGKIIPLVTVSYDDKEIDSIQDHGAWKAVLNVQ
jgi:hypothetical protein